MFIRNSLVFLAAFTALAVAAPCEPSQSGNPHPHPHPSGPESEPGSVWPTISLPGVPTEPTGIPPIYPTGLPPILPSGPNGETSLHPTGTPPPVSVPTPSATPSGPSGKPSAPPTHSSGAGKPSGPASVSPSTAPPATPTGSTGNGGGNGGAGQCNSGPVQCCNSVQSARSEDATKMLGLLGIVLENLDVPVGLTCSPITAIGLGGNSCTSQPVCCENNSNGGLINIGCVPINVIL